MIAMPIDTGVELERPANPAEASARGVRARIAADLFIAWSKQSP